MVTDEDLVAHLQSTMIHRQFAGLPRIIITKKQLADMRSRSGRRNLGCATVVDLRLG